MVPSGRFAVILTVRSSSIATAMNSSQPAKLPSNSPRHALMPQWIVWDNPDHDTFYFCTLSPGLAALSAGWSVDRRRHGSVVCVHRSYRWHEHGVFQHLVVLGEQAIFPANPFHRFAPMATGLCPGFDPGRGPVVAGAGRWCDTGHTGTGLAIVGGWLFGGLRRTPG